MEKEVVINRLKKEISENGQDYQSIDLTAMYDSSLSAYEAENILRQQLKEMGVLKQKPVFDKEELKELNHSQNYVSHLIPLSEAKNNINLDKIKSLAILGDINTGKTNLAFFHLNNYKGKRSIYLLGYPKEIKGFKGLSCFSDIFKVTDSIIFIDELSRYIKVYDREANYELMELISLFAHQGNTLIFTTQLSQFITRGVEAFIDAWNLTRLNDLATLKNGSKPKRIIQNTIHPKCNKWSLSLEKGEYLEFSEMNELGSNGVKEFPNQNIGKDWKNTKVYKEGGENSDKNSGKNSGENSRDNGELEKSAEVNHNKEKPTCEKEVKANAI